MSKAHPGEPVMKSPFFTVSSMLLFCLLSFCAISSVNGADYDYLKGKYKGKTIYYGLSYTMEIQVKRAGKSFPGGFSVSGKVTRAHRRGPIRAWFDPQSNSLWGWMKDKTKNYSITGYYDPYVDAFRIEFSEVDISFVCKWKGKKRKILPEPTPAPTVTPVPTSVPDYYIFLLTNASNGLYIGTEESLVNRTRCSFEGGGINCSPSDLVTYQMIDGTFHSRSAAVAALCSDITAIHYFPLGVGLKGKWRDDDSRWYGLWDDSVTPFSQLCPYVPAI